MHHTYKKGDTIIKEGERDARMFIIIHGSVDVIKNLGRKGETHLDTLKEHDYFGEMSLIDDMERSSSVVAREDTEVLSLSREALMQAIVSNPTVAMDMLQLLSKRVRVSEKHMLCVLGSLLPVCANCKRVREEDGTWSMNRAVYRRAFRDRNHARDLPGLRKKTVPEFVRRPEGLNSTCRDIRNGLRSRPAFFPRRAFHPKNRSSPKAPGLDNSTILDRIKHCRSHQSPSCKTKDIRTIISS